MRGMYTIKMGQPLPDPSWKNGPDDGPDPPEVDCPECGEGTEYYTEIDGCDGDCPRRPHHHGYDGDPCGGKCAQCEEQFCMSDEGADMNYCSLECRAEGYEWKHDQLTKEIKELRKENLALKTALKSREGE